jgi:hypothetical protein
MGSFCTPYPFLCLQSTAVASLVVLLDLPLVDVPWTSAVFLAGVLVLAAILAAMVPTVVPWGAEASEVAILGGTVVVDHTAAAPLGA